MTARLGFSDRKTTPPQNTAELLTLLSQVLSAAINNEIDLDNARVALNAATRMVEVIQADTRMKAVAAATGRMLTQTTGFALIEAEKEVVAG